MDLFLASRFKTKSFKISNSQFQ